MPVQRWIHVLLVALAFQFLVGCSSKGGPDPWEDTNRAFYKFNDNLDRAILKPVADGYVRIVPKPIRTGINNGFNNLGYIDVIVNDFLQGKFEHGWQGVGRMAVNSTVGIAGVIDVATPLGLPARDNDFGITLGKWGVKPGPYIVLPLFGPSTARDLARIPVGMATNPLTYVSVEWYVSIPLSVLKTIDTRTEIDRYLKMRDANALDGYVFMRDAYLQNRESKIRDGAPVTEPGLYDDPDAPPATAPSPNTLPPAAPLETPIPTTLPSAP